MRIDGIRAESYLTHPSSHSNTSRSRRSCRSVLATPDDQSRTTKGKRVGKHCVQHRSIWPAPRAPKNTQVGHPHTKGALKIGNLTSSSQADSQ